MNIPTPFSPSIAPVVAHEIGHGLAHYAVTGGEQRPIYLNVEQATLSKLFKHLPDCYDATGGGIHILPNHHHRNVSHNNIVAVAGWSLEDWIHNILNIPLLDKDNPSLGNDIIPIKRLNSV
jgi:hypothetical protein